VTQESIADYLSSGRSRGNAPVIQPPASSPLAMIGPAEAPVPGREKVAA